MNNKKQRPQLTDLSAIKSGLVILSGDLMEGKITLYTVMRNEIYFAEAFFSHYRAIGVEQFLILDDKSDDGTLEFISAQPDCVVLRSEFGFGHEVFIRRPDGNLEKKRAGTLFKRAIPEKYLLGQWSIYVDADEFLVLPSKVTSIRDMLGQLDAAGLNTVVAAVIDFYPEDLSGLCGSDRATSLPDLLKKYHFFDAVPIVRLVAGKQPRTMQVPASSRLFRSFGIKEPRGMLSWLPEWAGDLLPFPSPRTAWFKTPIVRWSSEVWLEGSHKANVLPPIEVLLPIIHFKFTGDFRRRIDAAILNRSHFKGSVAYRNYDRLLERMRRRGADFRGPDTKPYRDVADFEATGLCIWPERFGGSRN
jgi:hypothetical protein